MGCRSGLWCKWLILREWKQLLPQHDSQRSLVQRSAALIQVRSGQTRVVRCAVLRIDDSRPPAKFSVGDRVRIRRGSYEGYEGVIEALTESDLCAVALPGAREDGGDVRTYFLAKTLERR